MTAAIGRRGPHLIVASIVFDDAQIGEDDDNHGKDPGHEEDEDQVGEAGSIGSQHVNGARGQYALGKLLFNHC